MAPLLVALLIGFFSFALMLLARYQVHSLTVATVRSCVALQNTGDPMGQYTQCLQSRFQFLYGQAQSRPCNGTPTVTGDYQALTPTGPLNGSAQRIYLLRAQVSCEYRIDALGAFLPGAASKVTIQVTSAMPFVKG